MAQIESTLSGSPVRTGDSLARRVVVPILFGVILLWVNAYICRDLFFGPKPQMNSMQGSWAGLARLAGDSWFRSNWWPFWDLGGPFEYTYAPLVPGLTALWSSITGVNHLILDFHFDDLLDNFLASADAFIHAGSKLMTTLPRSTPNG